MQTSLLVVDLMFWPLLYIGMRDGDLKLSEGLVLGTLWLLFLLIVVLGHKSIWYFHVPATLLTIGAIWRVLGPDASLFPRRY